MRIIRSNMFHYNIQLLSCGGSRTRRWRNANEVIAHQSPMPIFGFLGQAQASTMIIPLTLTEMRIHPRPAVVPNML